MNGVLADPFLIKNNKKILAKMHINHWQTDNYIKTRHVTK